MKFADHFVYSINVRVFSTYFNENNTKCFFFSDQNNLFAPTWSPFLFLAIYHYKKTALPCRVTDPSIDVKLINAAGNQEVALGDGTGVTYDPRLGFILHYPNQYYEGQFECLASAPWGKRETQIMVLRYLSKLIIFTFFLKKF